MGMAKFLRRMLNMARYAGLGQEGK